MNELDILEQIASEYPEGITSKPKWLEITKKIKEKIIEYGIIPDRDPPLIEHNPEYDVTGTPPISHRGGIVSLREGCEFEVFEDIKLVEIDALYPSITKMLIESDILQIQIEDEEGFNDVFLSIFNSYQVFKMGSNRRSVMVINGVTQIPNDVNMNLDGKLCNFYKTWLNWSYGMIIAPFANIYFTEYVRDIMEKIIYQIPWIYVDTDSIYYVGKPDSEIENIIGPMCFEYEIQDINLAIFKAKKKYVTVDKFGKTKTKGMLRSKTNDSDYELMANKLMSRNREKLINTLI